MHLFLIKPKLVNDPRAPEKKISAIRWMKPDVAYPVFDIYKYKKSDKEAGTSRMITLFLSANKETGELAWIDAAVVDYVEE